jgi:hypothetical protein
VFAHLIRPLRRLDLRSPGVAALLAFAVALACFALIKAHTAFHYALSEAEAAKIARSNRLVARILAGHENTSVRVTPIDNSVQRVTFFDGSRVLVNSVVGPQGRVTYVAGPPVSGSTIANAPRAAAADASVRPRHRGGADPVAAQPGCARASELHRHGLATQ